MSVKISDLLVDLFFAGGFFVTHYVACQTGEDVYVIESLEQEVIFEVTERWFKQFTTVHKKKVTQRLPCGCVAHIVVPSDQNVTPSGLHFHMN